jgi:endogenous inhibitor of DNA gyrase (YacG/DUF329 family)
VQYDLVQQGFPLEEQRIYVVPIGFDFNWISKTCGYRDKQGHFITERVDPLCAGRCYGIDVNRFSAVRNTVDEIKASN